MNENGKMGRPLKVGDVDFVTAWQESSSANEVAQKTGMCYSATCARASRLRKRGVQLKNHGHDRTTRPSTTEELNHLIKELDAKGTTQ